MAENSKEITKSLTFSLEAWDKMQNEIKNVSDFKEKIDIFTGQNITEFSKIILGGGIKLKASDLHIEPDKKGSKLRMRVDGVLQDITIINKDVYQNLLSRIKLFSGVKLNVVDRPQDGRFSVLLTGDKEHLLIEIRVSTLPSEYGESIVLRILNPKSLISFSTLGLREDLLSLVEREIKKPHGMVIITGPTGSGKTTTLYACLKQIQKSTIKIITIEDPIEYHLKGVSQTQVSPKKGYDFSSGLESIMRQDPNVILVGEVRDLETAKIALQAALTGHLVFTTLHANDAAGTIARLTNLGAKMSNIGPAINISIAQRLVRVICKECSKLKKPSLAELKKIKTILRGIPKSVKLPKIGPSLKIPEAVGCKFCNSSGYRGRIGVFEALLINDEMENFILKNPSIANLRKKAIKQGMVTMYQDGFIKVLNGLTTIKEVEKTFGE